MTQRVIFSLKEIEKKIAECEDQDIKKELYKLKEEVMLNNE